MYKFKQYLFLFKQEHRTKTARRLDKTIQHEEQSQVADAAETALKTWYTTTGSFVQMIPWIGDDNMHIMDIYTKLLLVKSDEQVGRKGKGETKLESYEGIFVYDTRDGHLIKRAILNGSAGLGKTTLFDKWLMIGLKAPVGHSGSTNLFLFWKWVNWNKLQTLWMQYLISS